MNWSAPARAQARSMVVSQYGIVASSQFLASQAGARMLEAGGNAVDAAITANAVLGLTQPYANGIGGDLFAIVYDAKTDTASWPELQRMDAEGPLDRGAPKQGHKCDRSRRRACGYRSGMRGRLGRA